MNNQYTQASFNVTVHYTEENNTYVVFPIRTLSPLFGTQIYFNGHLDFTAIMAELERMANDTGLSEAMRQCSQQAFDYLSDCEVTQ